MFHDVRKEVEAVAEIGHARSGMCCFGGRQ